MSGWLNGKQVLWKAISKSNANQQLFTTLLGGAMQIGGAFAGKP